MMPPTLLSNGALGTTHAALGLAIWLSGCQYHIEPPSQTTHPQPPDHPVYALPSTPRTLIEQSYDLADRLIRNMEEVAMRATHTPIGKDAPFLVATFVDVTSLQPEARFGRIVADQVAARFVQQGYHLVEARLRKDGIAIYEGMGELMLSRKLQEVGQSFDAAYVITGTYSVGTHSVFLNAKVIAVMNSRVLASGDVELEKTRAVSDLVQRRKTPHIKRFTDESTQP